MRGRNLKKILDAINLLTQPGGTTVSALGEWLGIEKRQVYRTLETLQDDFKLVLVKEKAMFGEIRYSLEKDQFKRVAEMRVPNLNLSPSEIIALCFLRGNAKLYRGSGIDMEIEQAFAKLEVFVPKGFAHRLEKIRTLFLASSRFGKDYSGKEEILNTLVDAILQQKTCLVEYHAFHDDRIKCFKIDPLHFFERNGGIYVFVRTTRFGDIRTMAVERILNLTMTDEVFEYPEEFDPDTLLEEAFDLVYGDPVTVRIRFSAAQARYIEERRWAKKQEIYQQEDGSLILMMTTSGWWDVKRWILSFGRDAQVLDPLEMREMIMKELRESLKVYDQYLS